MRLCNQLALNFENSNLSGNSMELDNLNSFSDSRRNNFSRRPNSYQRNTRPNFQRSHNFRNSNFPRPFLNFSRNPPQNNFRYRQRKPQSNFGQSNSFSSFRSPNNQHFNLLIKLNSLADQKKTFAVSKFQMAPQTV